MTTITECSIEQAYLLKARLEAENVPTYVLDENAATTLPLGGTPTHCVRVQVADEHSLRAHAVIQEIQNCTPEKDESGQPFVSERANRDRASIENPGRCGTSTPPSATGGSPKEFLYSLPVPSSSKRQRVHTSVSAVNNPVNVVRCRQQKQGDFDMRIVVSTVCLSLAALQRSVSCI